MLNDKCRIPHGSAPSVSKGFALMSCFLKTVDFDVPKCVGFK